MRTVHPRADFGIRKAELFNERFKTGDLVAVRRVPGEPATWDRIFSPAYGAGDAAMVELASSLVPVDTDTVFVFEKDGMGAAQPEVARMFFDVDPQPTCCREPRNFNAWVIACAFLLGFASAVLLAFSHPTRSTAPAGFAPEITSEAGESA